MTCFLIPTNNMKNVLRKKKEITHIKNKLV